MTLTAVTFAIRTLGGDALGLAVVCHDARYASVQWASAPRLDRLHPSPAEWREIEHQIRNGMDPRPLSLESPVGTFLGSRGPERRRVAWLSSLPIEVRDPLATVHALDAHLTKQAIEFLLKVRTRQAAGD